MAEKILEEFQTKKFSLYNFDRNYLPFYHKNQIDKMKTIVGIRFLRVNKSPSKHELNAIVTQLINIYNVFLSNTTRIIANIEKIIK